MRLAEPSAATARQRTGSRTITQKNSRVLATRLITGLPAEAVENRLLLAHEGVAVVGGRHEVSLIVRALTHRIRFHMEPALSFVPEARAPPNGCWPTTAPVGLSFT